MLCLEFNKDLIWQSDWAGDEVGHDDVNIVGLYMLAQCEAICFYIDMEEMRILEVFVDVELVEN